MFESLKTWLEGLFRPIIRIVGSESYIARTPTINDVQIVSNVKFVRRSPPQAGLGGSVYPFGVISASGKPLLIRSLTVYQTAGAIDLAGYGISSGLTFGIPTTWDEVQLDGALDAYGMRQVIRPDGPVIVPNGYTLYLVTYDGGNANRTVIIYCTYTEV